MRLIKWTVGTAMARQSDGRRGQGAAVYRRAAGLLIVGAALLCAMSGAHAACRTNTGGSGPSGQKYDAFNRSLFQVTVTPMYTSFVMPPDPKRGDILFSTYEAYLPTLSGAARGRAAPLYGCPVGEAERFIGGTTLVAGMPTVYRTAVQGVGYRVYYYISDSQAVAAPVAYLNPYASGVLYFPFNGAELGSNVRTRIDFIATGEPFIPGTVRANTTYGLGRNIYRVGLSRDVIFSQPTCTVSPATLSITLPDLPASQLAGDPNGPISEGRLTATCSQSSQVSPIVTVRSNNPANGFKNVLANSAPELTAAQGVGIALLIKTPGSGEGTFVPANLKVAYPNLGEPVGSLPTSQWLFQIGARIQLLGNYNAVRAGEVQGLATVTFTYS